jgi:hypothetical protein
LASAITLIGGNTRTPRPIFGRHGARQIRLSRPRRSQFATGSPFSQLSETLLIQFTHKR